MKKVPCIKNDNCHYLLLKDYQDFFNGWVVLIITKNEIFTKADERIIGDAKMAEEKFKELYSYKAEFSYKTIKEVV
jgi:hypothetical protein